MLVLGFSLLLFIFLFYVHWCFVCMYACLCKSVGSPGTRATDSYEVPHRYWELNPGSLGKQPVLLTTGPSLQPWSSFINVVSKKTIL